VSALLQLAERCEKAVGPNRELDVHIALEVGTAELADGYTPEQVFGIGCHAYDGLAYTASLDAAMQLVPEGWQGEGLYWWSGCPAGCVLVQTHFADGQWVRETGFLGRVKADAATSALALCAAALRARAAS
jgi:hypothetical protein